MPELPEVESVRTGLEMLIKDAIIQSVDVKWSRIISEPDDSEEFKLNLKGQQIESLKRRGKFLLFYLTDYVMISHLRMEGKYTVVENEQPIMKHTHVIFKLEDGRELRYLDVRKFGRMALVKKGEEYMHPSLMKLGPEPIASQFLFEAFKELLSKRKKAIKAVLLDQGIVAGVGNIYADEILHEAGIHPSHPASHLSQEQVFVLHQAIIAVMGRAVKAGGTTIRSYKNAFGQEGTYQQSLLVYGRPGEECTRCGTLIKKIKVSQRGTHYCPACQPEWS
jgi:formamidopyrimidine-DNA glycosylase